MKNLNEEKLEQKLKTLAGEVKPSKNFEKVLLTKVKSQFKATHGQSFWQNFGKFKVQFAGVFALLALAITTNYAYKNNSVVPGEILYPVKRGAEKIESIFVPEGLPKSDYYLDMAERRTEELQYIDEDVQFENTADETREFLNKAKEELEESESEPSEEAAPDSFSNSQTMMMEMSDEDDEDAEDASGVDTTDQENDEEIIKERIQDAEEELEEAEDEHQEETTDYPASETPAPEAQ